MSRLPWERDAEKALGGAPFFVRPLVRKKVEERVLGRGGKKVTLEDYREAEARFKAVMAGKSEKELEQMMPKENEAGVELVILETCHNEASNCPNVLIKTAQWKEAIEKWIKNKNVSERLRKMVRDDKVYYHHKLRISIAGCPNGCSRPQIADIGLTGFVRPAVDPADCITCGACADICPDRAITVEDAPPVFDYQACQGCTKCRDICPNSCITLSEPAMRVSVGGKLGRHPHLADVVREVRQPEEVVEYLDGIINDFIEQAKSGERFADFWTRYGKEKKQ